MKILKTLIIILVVPVAVRANSTGASFLKISPGATPAGMGGAYTAIKGGIGSLYYNPAGISSIRRPQFGASRTEWISDIRFNYAAGAFNLNKGVLGVSATLLTMGEMEGRGDDREETQDFGASDFAFQASYGRGIYGGSFKIIRQQIADETALGIAVDAGINKELTAISNNLNLGIAVKNMGPKMSFMSEGYNLPLTLSLGLGYNYGALTFAADGDYEPVDKNFKVSLGSQWQPMGFLSVRGGYFLNLLKNISGSQSETISLPSKGLGGGVGLNIGNYSMNYAVVPYNNLGTTQRVSILGRF